MSTNLAISPPETKENTFDFTPENFNRILLEITKLREERILYNEKILKKNDELITLKKELIDLYLEKTEPSKLADALKSVNRDLMSAVLDYQKKELDGLRATNPVMYVSK
jgi:hypothetical protein